MRDTLESTQLVAQMRRIALEKLMLLFHVFRHNFFFFQLEPPSSGRVRSLSHGSRPHSLSIPA